MMAVYLLMRKLTTTDVTYSYRTSTTSEPSTVQYNQDVLVNPGWGCHRPQAGPLNLGLSFVFLVRVLVNLIRPL